MTRIQVDYIFVFDLDNIIDWLKLGQLDSIMTLEAADWWSSPEEKEYHRCLLEDINNRIELMQFDYGDNDDDTSD